MFMSMEPICALRTRRTRGVRLLGAVAMATLLGGCSMRAAPLRAAAVASPPLQSMTSIAAVAPAPGEVIVSDLLVSPGNVDADGDGKLDPVRDEFIELENRLSVPIDLEGVTLHDASGPRYVFPAGAYLSPGGVLVLYGSDAPLSLDDDGDRVRLVSASGITLHEVGYTSADVVIGISLSNLIQDRPSPSPALATSDLLWHGQVLGAFDSNSPGTTVDGLPCR